MNLINSFLSFPHKRALFSAAVLIGGYWGIAAVGFFFLDFPALSMGVNYSTGAALWAVDLFWNLCALAVAYLAVWAE